MSNSAAPLILFDTHCHLDLPAFDSDRADVVERARAAGVQMIVNPGIDLAQCERALALAGVYPGLFVGVGIHPNSAGQFDSRTVECLAAMAQQPKVVAIGEIGLDYYWDKVNPAQQRAAFITQLELAADLGLPVIIHSRDANDDVAAVVREWVSSDHFRHSPLAARPFAGVLHAFSGDLALAQEAYGWNFVVSLGGPVTFKNARTLHALVLELRLDRLMLETDAPYLTPHPYRGQRNEPAYTAFVCEQIARLIGISAAELAATTSVVARQFFQVEELLSADVRDNHEAAHV